MLLIVICISTRYCFVFLLNQNQVNSKETIKTTTGLEYNLFSMRSLTPPLKGFCVWSPLHLCSRYETLKNVWQLFLWLSISALISSNISWALWKGGMRVFWPSPSSQASLKVLPDSFTKTPSSPPPSTHPFQSKLNSYGEPSPTTKTHTHTPTPTPVGRCQGETGKVLKVLGMEGGSCRAGGT